MSNSAHYTPNMNSVKSSPCNIDQRRSLTTKEVIDICDNFIDMEQWQRFLFTPIRTLSELKLRSHKAQISILPSQELSIAFEVVVEDLIDIHHDGCSSSTIYDNDPSAFTVPIPIDTLLDTDSKMVQQYDIINYSLDTSKSNECIENECDSTGKDDDYFSSCTEVDSTVGDAGEEKLAEEYGSKVWRADAIFKSYNCTYERISGNEDPEGLYYNPWIDAPIRKDIRKGKPGHLLVLCCNEIPGNVLMAEQIPSELISLLSDASTIQQSTHENGASATSKARGSVPQVSSSESKDVVLYHQVGDISKTVPSLATTSTTPFATSTQLMPYTGYHSLALIASPKPDTGLTKRLTPSTACSAQQSLRRLLAQMTALVLSNPIPPFWRPNIHLTSPITLPPLYSRLQELPARMTALVLWTPNPPRQGFSSSPFPVPALAGTKRSCHIQIDFPTPKRLIQGDSPNCPIFSGQILPLIQIAASGTASSTTPTITPNVVSSMAPTIVPASQPQTNAPSPPQGPPITQLKVVVQQYAGRKRNITETDHEDSETKRFRLMDHDTPMYEETEVHEEDEEDEEL